LERLPLDELHDQEVAARAVALVAADVEGPHNVWVADASADLRLAQEPRVGALVLDEVRVEHLDRDDRARRPRRPLLLRDGAVHRAHAAPPDLAADAVAAESPAFEAHATTLPWRPSGCARAQPERALRDHRGSTAAS